MSSSIKNQIEGALTVVLSKLQDRYHDNTNNRIHRAKGGSDSVQKQFGESDVSVFQHRNGVLPPPVPVSVCT